MPTVYPPLSIGAPARLAQFRKEATRPGWVNPMTWRDVRFATLKSDSGVSRGSDSWYAYHGKQFRREQFSSDVIKALPPGWYTDTGYSETARGVVVSLPHGKHIAGYYWAGNGERVYFPEIYDCAEDAARAGNSHAESFADNCMEDSERFDAMRDAEDELETALETLRDTFAMRHSRRTPDDVREACEKVREARETLQEATHHHEGGAK